MRIATYNVEWFNSLFDDHGQLLADDGPSGRYKVSRAQQIEALGIVFTAIDADAVMVIEAPDGNRKRSTVQALENFAATFDLRTRNCVIGFQNHTQQEIALLFDAHRLTAAHDPLGSDKAEAGGASPRFDGVFRWDIDVDAQSDPVQFSKPPLEIAATANGRALRLVGVHVKSKAPHGAKTPAEIMREAIDNRRKQLAQCIWLRARVDEHLARSDSLIVLGDLNDGPGLDEYEELFGRSGVEIVMGETGQAPLFDPHAHMAQSRRGGAAPATSRFFLADQGRYLQALLDYILVSPDLRGLDPKWRIWHPFDDPGCYNVPELREALLTASDHFPVTLDIDL